MNILTLPLVLALLSAGNTGTAVLPLMKIGQGPRQAAMGESFTGLADDVSSVYWNPAGLGRIDRWQLGLSHHQWFADIKDEVVHGALPLGPGALGLGVVYAGEPGVEYWDEALGDFATATTWSTMVTAGYGLRLAENYNFGLTAKALYEDLLDEQAWGGGVDLGAVARPLPGLGIGVAARHFGLARFTTGDERLPAEVATGLSWDAGVVRATLDAVFPLFDNDPNFRAGIEVSPVPVLALRAGYRTGPVDLQTLGALAGITAGIGIAVGGIGIDYAFVPYGELGMTHRVGIRTVPASLGDLVVTVVDARTHERLTAFITASGVADVSANLDQLTLFGLRPGNVLVRATCDGYAPGEVRTRVVAGRTTYDTIPLEPNSARLIGGIYDARTKLPIGGSLAYRGPVSGRIPVASIPGTFTVDGITPGAYTLDAAGPSDDYLAQTCQLDVPAGRTTQRDFYLWRRGDYLILEGVNFETGKADILPQFIPILDRAGEILRQTPDIRRVELAGHTDPRDISTSTFPSNWELSDARAKAVRAYLIEKWGIAPDRLTTRGYADTQPITTNSTFEGMARNRRTEMRILE